MSVLLSIKHGYGRVDDDFHKADARMPQAGSEGIGEFRRLADAHGMRAHAFGEQRLLADVARDVVARRLQFGKDT